MVKVLQIHVNDKNIQRLWMFGYGDAATEGDIIRLGQ